MKSKIKLITHDRVAHADDAMAAGILRMAYGDVEVLRTRDPIILKEEAGKPDTFFLDVGGRYDPALRLFDHHQPKGAGFRNEAASEWPFATAGLVWKHYGKDAVRALQPSLPDADVAEVVKHIDDTLMKYIDAVDCGVRLKTSGPSLSAIIGSFNTAWYEEGADVFPLVMELSQVILSNFIKRYVGKVLARDKVRQAPAELDGRVLVLDGCYPWVTVVAEERPDVMFVVYPVGDSAVVQWQLRAAVHADLSPRIKMPMSWAGLERNQLSRVSGEFGAVFCHRSRHLAGAQSLDGALNLAATALREQETFV